MRTNVKLRLPDWVGAVRRAERRTVADELAVVAEESARVGRDRWPVLTGRSRAGFNAERTAEGAKVVNRVDYTRRVRDGESWRLFLAEARRILRRAVPGIASRTARRIADAR